MAVQYYDTFGSMNSTQYPELRSVPDHCNCRSCYELQWRAREKYYYLERENRELKNLLYKSPNTAETMNKLTVLAKKLLDSDTKILVRAGILNSDLEISEKGRNFLLAQYLAQNKKTLAVLAKEIVEEAREDKE